MQHDIQDDKNTKKLNIHKDKNIVPCIAKKDIHIYVVYSRPTAGPIGLKFFVDTWVAGGSPRLKKSKIFFFQIFKIFFFPRATPGSSASWKYNQFIEMLNVYQYAFVQ